LKRLIPILSSLDDYEYVIEGIVGVDIEIVKIHILDDATKVQLTVDFDGMTKRVALYCFRT